MSNHSTPLRVGQFSAYYGDRDGMRELIADGVDVLTGDYLAELTLLVLRKNQLRGGVGFATGFLRQLAENVDEIAAKGIRVVTNAGGLDPLACAEEVRKICFDRGLDLKVAAITGDDLMDALPRLESEGARFLHVEDRRPWERGDHQVLTANAYLGAWPIVAALKQDADIVICPRVTDASLVMGPAAWHFGWGEQDWDKLAGALWAGHAIECGGQVTGGNFSFFHEHSDLGLPGMPIAEIDEDGACVITKSAGSGGVVTVDTVKAQLLYEVSGARYDNPDVIGDLSSLIVTGESTDRVRVSGARGAAPSDTTKLSLCYEGGFRNTLTVGLTGGQLEAKVAWLKRQIEHAVGAPETFDSFRYTLIGPARPHDGSLEESSAWLVVAARHTDRERVGRAGFADPITQLGVSNIPGFYLSSPPQKEKLVGVQWPCLVQKSFISAKVVMDGSVTDVAWAESEHDGLFVPAYAGTEPVARSAREAKHSHKRLDVEFSSLIGTRSGDKGGMANLGVWTRNAAVFSWVADHLTEERLKELLPELAQFRVTRHLLPNLGGMNFMVHDYLEMGVASCTRIDAQAKGLGEYLGSRIVSVPAWLLESASEPAAELVTTQVL
jgi:hypothetical protein